MDNRIKKIKSDYFEVLNELKKAVELNENIMPYLDRIELFWLKKKMFLEKFIELNRFSYIGGSMYIEYDENEHRMPLALNKFILMDEPLCKTINMIRADEVTDEKRVKEVIKNVVNNLIKNKKAIMNSNTIIAPIRLFYSYKNELNDLATAFTNSFISNSCKKEINQVEDFIDFSKTIQSVKDFNNLIDTRYFFTCAEDVDLPSFDKIINHCSHSGMKVNEKDYCSVLYAYYYSVYGLMCQALDLIYISYDINFDLFVFRNAPLYYLNIIKMNLSDNLDIEKDLITNAEVYHFTHKALNSYHYLCNGELLSKKEIFRIYKAIENDESIYTDNIINPKRIKEIVDKEIKK